MKGYFKEIAAPVKKKINGLGFPFRWPRDILYPLKLALTSPTSGGRSVGVVRLLTKATEFVFVCYSFVDIVLCYRLDDQKSEIRFPVGRIFLCHRAQTGVSNPAGTTVSFSGVRATGHGAINCRRLRYNGGYMQREKEWANAQPQWTYCQSFNFKF
jgi:hypothetical protein